MRTWLRSSLAATCALIPGAIALAAPRDVHIRSINLTTGVIELFNYGATNQSLAGFQFCTQDADQVLVYTNGPGLNAFTIEAGTSFYVHFNNDAPGGSDSVNRSAIGSFASPFNTGPYSLALYFPPVNFANGATMADFVQWNIGGAHNSTADERTDEAVNGGLWTGITQWVSTAGNTELIELKAASGGQILHGPSDYDTVASPGCPNAGCEDGDVDGDCMVGLSDLSDLLTAFGTNSGDPGYDPDVDIDGDGSVGLSDLSDLLTQFGNNCN